MRVESTAHDCHISFVLTCCCCIDLLLLYWPDVTYGCLFPCYVHVLVIFPPLWAQYGIKFHNTSIDDPMLWPHPIFPTFLTIQESYEWSGHKISQRNLFNLRKRSHPSKNDRLRKVPKTKLVSGGDRYF